MSHGPRTSAAVRAFKRVHGLADRDWVGDVTARVMFSDDAKPAPDTIPSVVRIAPWLTWMQTHIGQAEVPGPKHNPLIVEWGRRAGIGWWNNDDDAWCAVFVNGALVATGYPSTRSALARSFLAYGVALRAPVPGAIVVFPRGSNPLYGHVAVVERITGNVTDTIDGNVANQVARRSRATSTILPRGIRWPSGAALPDGAQLLR